MIKGKKQERGEELHTKIKEEREDTLRIREKQEKGGKIWADE